VTAIGLSSDARQDIHRQAAERLPLMGRAVSVSQSLPGLRSCQSQPHGCCQRSGFAAGFPTRPAKSVLGGSATSSAPAFPSSCAAATAAAAAGCGPEVVNRYDAIRDKAHHLCISALYYSCTIGVLNLPLIETNIFQALLYTAIPSIVDNETIFDSPLRGNFGPTSANGSASPSLSGTHCGREHLCSAEGDKAVCQPSEAARGVFSRLPEVHRTHQRRRSRHRRVNSCCRSWPNARKDSGHCRWRVNVHRLSLWAERNRKIVIPPPQAPAERQTSGHL
jgi:hypothetical protein